MTEEEIKSLEMIFADLFLFIDELTKDYGEPVKPTANEIEKLKQTIINNPANIDPRLQKHFYLIERVEGEVLFSFNVDKCLGLEGAFDLMTFHSYIQDGVSGWHYLRDYLSWGKVGYLFFREITKYDDIQKYSFKTRLPMRCVDGRIYWVLQESWPLEFDEKNNMISHINNYTITQLYNEKMPVELVAEFYCEGYYSEKWNKMYNENRYAVKPFVLSPAQREILHFYYHNHKGTILQCANFLKYRHNTLKKYISNSQHKSGILDKAKISFPQIPIQKLNDVVNFLDKIGWYQTPNRV